MITAFSGLKAAMDGHHRLASPASPHCLGVGRRHSPWTASRQRKKNRQGDEHLPVCISEDEEAQEASMSQDCEDMVLDLHHMGLSTSRMGKPGRSIDERSHSFLFLPPSLAGPRGDVGNNTQPTALFHSPLRDTWDLEDACGRIASADHLPHSSRPVVSPRRNSASVILSRGAQSHPSLATLSPVALSSDHITCASSSGTNAGGSSAVFPVAAPPLPTGASSSGGGDDCDQRKSTKRRSLEHGGEGGSLSQALRSYRMVSVRDVSREPIASGASISASSLEGGAGGGTAVFSSGCGNGSGAGSGAGARAGAGSGSPSVRQRRRASLHKCGAAPYPGRGLGDHLPVKDQQQVLNHSQSVPFPLGLQALAGSAGLTPSSGTSSPAQHGHSHGSTPGAPSSRSTGCTATTSFPVTFQPSAPVRLSTWGSQQNPLATGALAGGAGAGLGAAAPLPVLPGFLSAPQGSTLIGEEAASALQARSAVGQGPLRPPAADAAPGMAARGADACVSRRVRVAGMTVAGRGCDGNSADVGSDRDEGDGGFRISTVLTREDGGELTASSEKLARRDQHLRAASCMQLAGLSGPLARGATGAGQRELQSRTAAGQEQGQASCKAGMAVSGASQGVSPHPWLSVAIAAAGMNSPSPSMLEEGCWPEDGGGCSGDESEDGCRGGGSTGPGCSGWPDAECGDELGCPGAEGDGGCSPMEGLAVRLVHTEEDFQTPPQSPQAADKREGGKVVAGQVQGTASRARVRQAHRRTNSSLLGDCSGQAAVEQLTTLEDFNRHLSKAAQQGNRGRADCLWSELCNKGITPNTQTLNCLLRCMANSYAHPDEAEKLARDVCKAGGLSPNALTHNLIAETQFRYEQLCGCGSDEEEEWEGCFENGGSRFPGSMTVLKLGEDSESTMVRFGLDEGMGMS